MAPREAWHLIKQSVSAWRDDYAPSMGAAIAYYTLFSIAPLLVIVIAIAGLAFGAEGLLGGGAFRSRGAAPRPGLSLRGSRLDGGALPRAALLGRWRYFPPARRASDKPIAMACLRLFTVFPLLPLFSLPRLRSCSAFSTFSAALPSVPRHVALLWSSGAARESARVPPWRRNRALPR
jgi:hypothetical protein